MFGCKKGWFWLKRSSIKNMEGLTYIGPCRCGFGPHAFYQDKSGRIVHAWQVCHRGVPLLEEDVKTELETLKEEKALLEKRIEELEKQLKEKNKEEN